MVASVSTSSLCPSCKEPQINIPDNFPYKDKCYMCGASLKITSSRFFRSPQYISYQKQRLLEEQYHVVDRTSEVQWQEQLNDIQQDLMKWLRVCPDKDKIAALEDALMIMENILFSSSSANIIKLAIKMGQNISKISDALDQYLKAGGCTYERKIEPLRSYAAYADGDQAAATAGRDS